MFRSKPSRYVPTQAESVTNADGRTTLIGADRKLAEGLGNDEFDKIRIERHDDGIRVLVLDDPEKRNAIGPAMRLELLDAADQLSTDTETRCLVVTGSGTSFCAGADLMAIFGVNGATPSSMRARQLSYYESFLWLRELPYPTVSAVNGHAIGAGLNLALACDITIAGPNASPAPPLRNWACIREADAPIS